jgi:hypothetical protein
VNRLVVVGFVLVLIGAVVPFLMVLGVLPSTFLLSAVSFFASLIGLVLGMLGAATSIRERRRRDQTDI